MIRPSIKDVSELLAAQPILDMEIGAGGKVVDINGRLVCTFNLKDLTLSEAFTLAKLLIVAAEAVTITGEAK